MPTHAPTTQDNGRLQSFFRQTAETSYKAPERVFRFEGEVPRLGPAIYNPETGSLGLRGVLLHNGGVAGCLYAQVPIDLQPRFMSKGWGLVQDGEGRPMPSYVIVGPEGSVDCVLLVAGEEIPGLPGNTSFRECLVHDEIWARTGLVNELSSEIREALGELVGQLPVDESAPGALFREEKKVVNPPAVECPVVGEAPATAKPRKRQTTAK